MSEKMDFKKKVELAYDDSSAIYDKNAGDRYVRNTHLILRDMRIPKNPTALDVACGTGISTFVLIEKCSGEGEFYGIDISQGMINKANENAANTGIENVVFKKGDAEHLEFPDSMFDLVISNSSFHWFPDKLKALSEMSRVLKPGGQVGLQFNGAQQFIEQMAIWRESFVKICGYAAPPISFLPSLEEVHEIFDKVKFENVRIHSKRSLVFYDPSVFLRQRDAATSFWQVGLTEEEVENIKREWFKEITRLSTEKGFKLTKDNIFAYGVKPE
jgi:SAM-dependent methyltransferase